MKQISTARLLVGSALATAAFGQVQLPAGKGKDVVERVCSPCHGVYPLTERNRDRAAWTATVNTMVSRGAKGSDDDLKLVIDYLSEHFAISDAQKANPDKLNINAASVRRLVNVLNLFPEEAEAIIDYREKNGPFKEWQDLQKVPGLDVKKIEDRKDRITF